VNFQNRRFPSGRDSLTLTRISPDVLGGAHRRVIHLRSHRALRFGRVHRIDQPELAASSALVVIDVRFPRFLDEELSGESAFGTGAMAHWVSEHTNPTRRLSLGRNHYGRDRMPRPGDPLNALIGRADGPLLEVLPAGETVPTESSSSPPRRAWPQPPLRLQLPRLPSCLSSVPSLPDVSIL
jgi:hypothetical protein